LKRLLNRVHSQNKCPKNSYSYIEV
jgi:hypothetical protein